MKFRTALVLGIVLVIAAMTTATVVAVSIIIDRAARRAVAADLHRSLDVCAELQTYRRTLLGSKARVLADEPRLKAVLATMDISAATVEGVARDLGRAIAVDLLVIVDAEAAVLAQIDNIAERDDLRNGDDLTGPDAAGHDLGADAVVAGALRHGHASGVWLRHDRVYQVQAARIGFGEEIIGVAVAGYLVDDRVAESVHDLTTGTVAIEHGDRLVALWPRRGDASDERDLAKILATLSGRASAPATIELDGDRYLAAAQSTGAGDEALRFAVLESLEHALAPGRRLQRVLFTTAALALAAAFFIALLLARRLSRPIDHLVTFTERVAAGDVQARARVSQAGAVELATLADAMNHMVERMDESRRQLAERERIEQEMAIAAHIQTSILPRHIDVPGFDVAALMVTADQVGGDYYDVLVREHTWIAIGDVAGHGVPAGLVMMMVQNVLSAVIQAWPRALPGAVLAEANRVLVDNVRQRLQRDEHVTLTLLRHDGDGCFVFAGAHEDIIIWRAATRSCEEIATPGTWLAAMPDIDRFLDDGRLELHPGDIMVLYTDGVTEARNTGGEQFGMHRLREAIEARASAPAGELCEHIVQSALAWSSEQEDDVTALVIRRSA